MRREVSLALPNNLQAGDYVICACELRITKKIDSTEAEYTLL
ncbi:hypothetical protein [Nitrosomonas sp. Nm58]|nr:hypothetical protein [Nitrosomonas sp. Nm58]